LSGYSFKISADGSSRFSGWKSAEGIFTTSELQKRYTEVEVSVFTPYCTLVPENFYRPEDARNLLADVVTLSDDMSVDSVYIPEFAAVMLYSNTIGGTLHKVISESVLMIDGSKARPLPELYYMLKEVSGISEYNRILASYIDGILYLVIAQGKSLMLCNTYQAPDFTTAEYFIFMAMKKLQLNPEVSSICFRTSLDEEQQMSLYRYFKNVEQL
jgi:hypothetical protein